MTDHVLVVADQVTAALTNADGTPNVYLTSDPSVNMLTLTLRNGLDHPVVFPAGTPVAFQDLPAGQSAVYIFPSGLLANADVAGIVPAAPGWAKGTYTDPATGFQYLVIAPASRVTLQPGDTLAFTLTHVLAAGEPHGGTAEIGLAGAAGLTEQQRDVPLFVNIASPPQPGSKSLEADVDIGFELPAAVYTGQAQPLTLRLLNKRRTALVPDGTPSWHDGTPTFQLTFVYGDSAGALTTVALAAQIDVQIYEENGNVWQAVVPHHQVEGPYWTMQPNPKGGGTVLGTGADATIEFAVTGIEASLPAGLGSAATVAYVSWYHVPSYHDGATAVIITKRAGPQVTLSADPPSVPFGAPNVHTVLTWDAANADWVRFDAPGIDPALHYACSGSGPGTGPGKGIDVPPGTTVNMTAYKNVAADIAPKPGALRQPADEALKASASLRFIRPARTDLTAPVGSLGAFAFPAGSTRAFVFQRNRGQVSNSELTKGVIFDLQKQAFTGTLDIKALVPSQGGGTLIHDVTPSRDGTTIHVLASSGEGASWLTPQYYLLPLAVASAAFGTAVSLGTLVPSGWALGAALLATADGRTVYVTANDLKTGYLHAHALDIATHTVRGSWTWQEPLQIGPALPSACTSDGNLLLMATWAGLAVIDVPSGFTMTGLWTTKDLKLIIGEPLVSPDRTRAYTCGIDNIQGPIHAQLLVIDVDLATGGLSLAKNKPLGLVPAQAGAPALSPDARTFYVMTDVDKLTAIDTATFDVVPYYCGTGGQFTPVTIAAGPQPGVIYGTGSNDVTNAVVSVVTLA